MTQIFGLGFVKPKKDIPGPSTAWVRFIREGYGVDEDKYIMLTSECVGINEFESSIDFLINELEIIRKL